MLNFRCFAAGLRRGLLAFVLLFPFSSWAQGNTPVVSYFGNEGREALCDVMQLSNGQFVLCGYASNLDWIEGSVPRTVIDPGTIANGLGSNRYGLMLLLSSDLQHILHVVHFPLGAVEDIRYIKTNSLPGAPTGALFISGNTSDTDNNNGGYFLARLNYNFIDGIPSAMTWHRNVWAKSYAKASHPWDVNAQGEVVHISGEAHGYDWSAIYWLDVNGNRKVVEHWRTHQKAAGGEWYGTPASSYTGGSINYSLIALKSWGRCDLRSWTMDEYTQMDADGNGGTRRGKWPMDLLYSGPCDPAAPNTDGPGYTGYSLESCCPVYGGSAV